MNFDSRFKFFRNLAISGVLAASFSIAHATTITYDLVNVTSSAGSLTGWVTINTSTDKVTAADITFNDALVGNPVFTDIGSPAAWPGVGQDYISGPSNSSLNWGGQIGLYYDTANIGTGDLAIYPVTTVQAYVSGDSHENGGPFEVTGGSLDPDPPAGVTPEPSSLILLGTGILGAAVLMGRFSRSRTGSHHA